MKITKKHTDGTIIFGALTQGDIFCSDNCFYLRCPTFYDNEADSSFNAINLATGLFRYFEGDKKVKKVENAELIVEF
jgi:hypothetical protein